MKNPLIALLSATVIALVLATGFTSQSNDGKVEPKDIEEGCKCYANGENHPPGRILCLGGHYAECVAQGSGDQAKNCGWEYSKDSNGNYIKCDE